MFVEVDKYTTLGEQMLSEVGPVVLINTLSVAPEDEEQFLAAWKGDAAVMQKQPGFISAQMHRGIAGSMSFLNYAVWESVEAFRNAFANPEFQQRLAEYPASAQVSPHLFKKIAIPGLCVA
jgi:heme-degrading monooxygenase HmoA